LVLLAVADLPAAWLGPPAAAAGRAVKPNSTRPAAITPASSRKIERFLRMVTPVPLVPELLVP
jgi:hypothetical protein